MLFNLFTVFNRVMVYKKVNDYVYKIIVIEVPSLVNVNDILIPSEVDEKLINLNVDVNVNKNQVFNVCIDEHGKYILCDDIIKFLKIRSKVDKVRVNVIGKCTRELVLTKLLENLRSYRYSNGLLLLKIIYEASNVLSRKQIADILGFSESFIRDMIWAFKKFKKLDLVNQAKTATEILRIVLVCLKQNFLDVSYV